MDDLGMELNPPNRLFLVGNTGERGIAGRGSGAESFRQLAQSIAVGHVLC